MSPRHQILFLDAHDSFSNNITSLLSTLLDADVHVLAIDSPLLSPPPPPPPHSSASASASSSSTEAVKFDREFRAELARYTAVVCGPGPGSPENEDDVGLMRHVWEYAEVPVLGICLGFQSLVRAFGGQVGRLKERGLHGMVREVIHRGGGGGGAHDGDIFQGVQRFRATLYHSLCADIGQHEIPDAEWAEKRWAPPPSSAGCDDLVPLAWVEEDRDSGQKERILMGVRHRSRPFWGLQYHPESVCTETEGNKVIENWFREALAWNRARRREVVEDGARLAHAATRQSLLSGVRNEHERIDTSGTGTHKEKKKKKKKLFDTWAADYRHHSLTVDMPRGITAPDIIEAIGSREGEHIILDSANAALPPPEARAVDVRGRYSIVALEVGQSLRLKHTAGRDFATALVPTSSKQADQREEKIPLGKNQTVWHLLAQFHEARRIQQQQQQQQQHQLRDEISNSEEEAPFLGGFMGYVTYEQGLQDIGVELPEGRRHQRPDVCLAWVTRSVVLDHRRGVAHVQCLDHDDAKASAWLEATVRELRCSQIWCPQVDDGLLKNGYHINGHGGIDVTKAAPQPKIFAPDPLEYERKVTQCQEHIAAGDSYELCVTGRTTILHPLLPSSPSLSLSANSITSADASITTTALSKTQMPPPAPPPPPSSWSIYRSLRTKQPASFASYIRLGGATLISSSPERFLQYDSQTGLCIMKPMKGTVRKSDTVRTLAQAEAILHTPKEEAENLMIVDLVRHDLHGICGAGNVRVPALLKVEENASVFSMITVVEGHLAQQNHRYTGLDVLAASLPPGSMTGAPKKRSCELLRVIEGVEHERSLYSGVVGYMCVSGRGDWSVTIRSLFRWDDEQPELRRRTQEERAQGEVDHEIWQVGAGGAVTALSTPLGEREEMCAKLAGPLSVFDVSV